MRYLVGCERRWTLISERLAIPKGGIAAKP